MTVDEAYDQITHTLFQNRVKHGLLKTALAVYNEATGTALHEERVVLAKKIAANPASYVTAFSGLIIANDLALAAEGVTSIPQADIESCISAAFNIMT